MNEKLFKEWVHDMIIREHYTRNSKSLFFYAKSMFDALDFHKDKLFNKFIFEKLINENITYKQFKNMTSDNTMKLLSGSIPRLQ